MHLYHLILLVKQVLLFSFKHYFVTKSIIWKIRWQTIEVSIAQLTAKVKLQIGGVYFENIKKQQFLLDNKNVIGSPPVNNYLRTWSSGEQCASCHIK